MSGIDAYLRRQGELRRARAHAAVDAHTALQTAEKVLAEAAADGSIANKKVAEMAAQAVAAVKRRAAPKKKTEQGASNVDPT